MMMGWGEQTRDSAPAAEHVHGHTMSFDADPLAATTSVPAPPLLSHLTSSLPEAPEVMDEAWVVVYGDNSLSSASLSGPDGQIAVQTSEGSVPRAGAYRTAYPSPSTLALNLNPDPSPLTAHPSPLPKPPDLN